MMNLYKILTYAAILLLYTTPSTTLANEAFHNDNVNLYNEKNFALGVGVGIVRFNTNAKVTDKTTGRTIFVDLEGSLNLPETSQVNTLYGAYKFNQNHSLLFGYFGIDRSSSLLNINKSFGDVTVEADLKITDRSRYYYLGYGYNLFRDNRSTITLIAGINGIDLNYSVDTSGQITWNGTINSNEKLLNANIFAPLPMLGMNFGFAFTSKWSMATKISVVGGSYDGISAKVLQTSINARYKLTNHVGILTGITYFVSSICIDDKSDVTDITYNYAGAFIGMHFGF
ncbi:MAG: hypothetical protein DRQ40_09875 [Gammaproteobacteria bacterium]|nr:MAG: hypothetical protein DRQ40_09875 [Gammaproteobacteria bacterium]